LFARWVAAGSAGDGIIAGSDQTIEIVQSGANLRGIDLAPLELFTIRVYFAPRAAAEPARGGYDVYLLDVQQTLGPAFAPMGGQRVQVKSRIPGFTSTIPGRG
jgi:hypothetical protein